MADDPYAVLGVAADAAHDDIRRAWLALARRHHPDRGGDAALMQAVNEAWAVLGDPVRRRAWDHEHGRATGSGWRAATPGGHPSGEDEGDDDWREVGDDWRDVGDDWRDLGDLGLFGGRQLAEPRRSAFDLVPVALFALAVAVGCVSLVLDAPAMLGGAVFLFFLSCLAVVAAAMLSMRRSVRAGRR